MPHRRTPAIEPPIPQRKHDHIGEPKQSAGAQKRERRFPMRWQRPNQEHDGTDQCNRGDAVDHHSQDAVERTPASFVGHHCRDEQNHDQRRQKPNRADDQVRWKGQIDSTDCQEGGQRLPPGFGFVYVLMVIRVGHRRVENRC